MSPKCCACMCAGIKVRPHKLDSQFIITTFRFFDEGGRSIFNIQYQYLDRGGRGLVFCSRFSAG